MSHTILPPRYEDRAAELEATFPAIPIYEEVSGSLRPTWIPVDPTTFVPPAPKRSRAKTIAIVVPLALLMWGLGFAAVIGGHAIEERYARKANAAPSQVSEPAPVAVSSKTTPAVATLATTDAAKPVGDSGIVLTVEFNDLPVIKADKKAKRRKAGS